MARDEDKTNRIIKLLAEQLGVSEDKIRGKLDTDLVQELGADSLDTVELIMELEDEFRNDSMD